MGPNKTYQHKGDRGRVRSLNRYANRVQGSAIASCRRIAFRSRLA